MKRAIRSGSFANASGRTLIATSRFSFVSLARWTTPIPPAPRAERILDADAGAGSEGQTLSIIRVWRQRGLDYS